VPAAHDIAFAIHHSLEASRGDIRGIILLTLADPLVSSMSARSKKSVSVAPGIKHVTVTPLSAISARSAKENESRKALLAL
jgi:hypothetical protein